MNTGNSSLKKVVKFICYILVFSTSLYSVYMMAIATLVRRDFTGVIGLVITTFQLMFLVNNTNLFTNTFDNIFMDLILPIINTYYYLIIYLLNYYLNFQPIFQGEPGPQTYMIYQILTYIGLGISFTGIIQIRKYFTVFTEAIGVYKGGLYKYVRHPIYTGYTITIIAMLILNFNFVDLLIFIVYVSLFYLRASREEEVLENTFGEEYAEYKRKTGMFFIKFPRKEMNKSFENLS